MNLKYLCVSFSDLSERFFVNFGKLFCGKLLCRFYSLLFLFGIFNVYACYCRIALFEHGYFSYCHCAVYAFAEIFLHYCSPFGVIFDIRNNQKYSSVYGRGKPLPY